MSTTVEPIHMSHAGARAADVVVKTPAKRGLPVFNKYNLSSVAGLPQMSSQTSLLDVIRSQGHAMLGVEGNRPSPLRHKESAPKPSKPASKPIRIVDHHADSPVTEEEEPLSSSEELERFYDQATWRMYILIQSARLANDGPMPKAMGGSRGRVPTTPHSHAPYRHHHHQHHHATHSSAAWTTTCPSTESEEDIFDFEL